LGGTVAPGGRYDKAKIQLSVSIHYLGCHPPKSAPRVRVLYQRERYQVTGLAVDIPGSFLSVEAHAHEKALLAMPRHNQSPATHRRGRGREGRRRKSILPVGLKPLPTDGEQGKSCTEDARQVQTSLLKPLLLSMGTRQELLPSRKPCLFVHKNMISSRL